MSLTDLISDNLKFAISQINVSLTDIPGTNPTTGVVGTPVTYSANKQDIETGYEIFEDGREEIADTRFYICKSDYSRMPSKGTILTDGTTNFKVMSVHQDAVGVTLRLDCVSEYHR
tara:strand:- start:1948 stop:2295 length:348 start_codon:yes stop_codon:yes gene_type:complete